MVVLYTVILLTLAVGICGCAWVYDFGHTDGVEEERKAAVEAGAAEWQVDPKTGERTFVYRPSPLPPTQ